MKRKKTICTPIPNQSPLNDTNGGGEVSWYWAWASFVRPRFVGRCWFQRPRSKAGTVLSLSVVCLPTALPYTPTITSHGPRSAPWADEDQAPGVQRVQPRPLAGGRRCSARTDHRWITCPAGGPEAGYFRSQQSNRRQLFLLWPASHPCIYGLPLGVSTLSWAPTLR